MNFWQKFKEIVFSNLINSLVVISIVFIFLFSLLLVFKWLLFSSQWGVVTQNLPLYAFGVFPVDQRWRPCLWLLILAFLSIVTIFKPRWSWFGKVLPIAWVGVIPLGVGLLSGGLGLLPVESRHWGGFTLTILLMSCSALLAFPLGIMFAIGRQSKLPLIKYFSALYIDALRAVPLISILFFGQLLIPLFLPLGVEINRVSRAVISFTLFVAAYIAEDIRGGWQAIPNSQLEASKALGLSQAQTIRFIILPQALTIALPALTNQAIGLLQNTSLMSILGLVELLGISRSILANPVFIGRYIEVYVWLAGIYWVICTVMALLLRQLEEKVSIQRRIRKNV